MDMSGIEARNLLDAEIKQFQQDNGGQVGTIYMSHCFALDLMKCKTGELPSGLLDGYARIGIEVLEKVGFQGFPVVLESAGEGFRIEPNES